MSKYIVTYTEYTPSTGNEDFFFVCNTLKEAEEKIVKMQNNKHYDYFAFQIYAAKEITKFVNFIKDEL